MFHMLIVKLRQITYPHLGGVGLIYQNFDNSTGCKDIIVKTGKSHWRIWVSDEDGDDRDIDTQHYIFTSNRLCSKWIHIHISHSIWYT